MADLLTALKKKRQELFNDWMGATVRRHAREYYNKMKVIDLMIQTIEG